MQVEAFRHIQVRPEGRQLWFSHAYWMAIDREGPSARMQHRPSRVERDLGELNRLADDLFILVRTAYVTDSTVTLQLDRSDRLVHLPIEVIDIANAALLCAQFLRRATEEPEYAAPRQVLSCVDALEQLITGLISARSCDRRIRTELTALYLEIDAIAMGLAVLVDPGAPRFSDG